MIQKKKVSTRKILLLFWFFWFLSGQIFSQSVNATFRNITPAEGLPTTTVTDVAQDAFGFIWIGSWDGGYRYDGRSFKKMLPNGARYLTADKKGGVWFTNQKSVGYFDPYADSVRNYKVPNADRYGDIRIDNSGEVWIATTDGVTKFNSTTNLFTKDKGQRSGIVYQLSAWGNGVLLFSFVDNKNKQRLIGRRDPNGVYTYEPYPIDPNNPENEKLFTSRVGVFLRPLDSMGILIINQSGWTYKNGKDSPWIFRKPANHELISETSDVKLDAHGNFWLNQYNALSKINIVTGEKTIYTYDRANPNSLLSMHTIGAGSDMFFDRQGVLWITRYSQGISRLNLFESDFGLLKDSTGLPVLDILSALESKDGTFWIGSRNETNGLIHYSADGKIIKTYGSKSFDSPPGRTVSKELSHPFAWALAESSDGSVWVGGGSPGPHLGGLSRIRPGSDQITRFKNDPSDSTSLKTDWIGGILVDGNDRVWLDTRAGISYIDPTTEKFNNSVIIQSPDKAKHTFYFPLATTATGDMLVVDPQYFKHYIIDHKTLAVKPFANELKNVDSIIFVHQDEAGKFWFVTPKGFGYVDSTFSVISHLYEFDKLGFPIEETPDIFNSDKQGNIWIATDNGIIEFDPATEKFKHFGFERGLQGNRFTIPSYKGPSGKIYFGGNGGINIFDPASIKTNPYPPQMVFTNLKLDGKSISSGEKMAIQKPIYITDKITVEPGVLTISIDFAAIHFAGNNNNQYQYKLEGFDKDWKNGGTIGNATYTNLSPGTYTLFIKGSNLDNVWSDGKKSIEIIILPPWWRTWWAYTLYALLLLFILWQFYRYQKIRTIRKERERTQQKELEQAKEIEKAYHELKSTQQQLIQSEKMASLGELTAGIAHEIQNPLNFVNNFSEVNKELIEELQEERNKMQGTRDEKLENEILNDIKENEEKINHHGKRADAIVKGMLQHSRSSTGVKELTDINALADEYLRLSYHGLRAKDNSFNATLNTDFDETIGKINIIPQDIGRVLLNLYNNAFYAVSERRKVEGIGYEPTVSVSTKKIADKVILTVMDNGNGIPQKVIDKIFQPFFTTKPTGQGTGLGLSLSYDIIKAHGGEIKVNTKENEGSEFIIELPLK